MLKAYEVVSPHRVRGYSTGERFEADLPEWQERLYIEGGFLRYVNDAPNKASSREEPQPEGASGDEPTEESDSGSGDEVAELTKLPRRELEERAAAAGVKPRRLHSKAALARRTAGKE